MKRMNNFKKIIETKQHFPIDFLVVMNFQLIILFVMNLS